MFCPHCGNHVIDGFESCPSCGMELPDAIPPAPQQEYDASQEYSGEGDPQFRKTQFDQAYEPYHTPPEGYDDSPQEGFSPSLNTQNTSIFQLDPEFQKGTRIVANPMLDNSSRKRARVRAGAPQARELPKDEISKLVYDVQYAFGRMNFLEKIALFLFGCTIVLSFAPWSTVVSSGRWISGYETLGVWVGISSFVAGILLLLKISMRLTLWATLLQIGCAFLAATFPLYLLLRRPLEGQRWMLPFHFTLGFSILAFLVAFLGAMRRLLK